MSWVGRTIADKYRVDRVVGEGGMGVVLAATHMGLDEQVAIKVLHPGAASDAETVARFLREGKIAARIKSEHLVRVRDVGRLDDGSPFMVMELLEGRDLGAVASGGQLSVTFAIDCVLQACDAIAEAHRRSIVHRDLKPSNLFLTQRRNGVPCVKVLDFGISKLQADNDMGRTSTKAVFGSPLYMSPEQLASSADVDARADVWALAMVLFELLTGRTAFERSTLAMLHVAILQEPAPDVRTLRPDTPEPVARAISAALAKRRDERTPTVADFAAALVPFASPIGAEAFRTIADSGARAISDPAISVGTIPTGTNPTAQAPLVAGGAAPGATQGAFASNTAPPRGRHRVIVASAIALSALSLLGGAVLVVRSSRAPTTHTVGAAPEDSSRVFSVPPSSEPSSVPSAPTGAPSSTSDLAGSATRTPVPSAAPPPATASPTRAPRPAASTTGRKLPDDRR